MKERKSSRRRFFSSMSFRINLVLIVVMAVLGWSFTKVMTMLVSGISNMARMSTMAKIVKTNIEGNVNHVESVMMTAALSARQKVLTEANSALVCDSIVERTEEIDTVFVAYSNKKNPDIESCIDSAIVTASNVWSNPHYAVRNGKKYPVVTFVTPIRNPQGRIYATLCANVNLRWLKDIADDEVGMGEAYITVTTEDGIYLYNRDSTKIMKNIVDVPQIPIDSSRVVGYLSGSVSIGEDNDNDAKIANVIDKTGWRVKCVVPLRDNNEMTMIISILVVVMLVLLFLAIISCIILTVNWQLRPLGRIADAADAIAGGDFNNKLPKVSGHSDISHLRDSFVVMQRELVRYIDDLRTTTEKKASMERDLHIAAQIQNGLIPKSFPAFPERKDIDIHGLLVPAKEVGGDIFDFFIQDERLFFIIGDVSGKGVPASLFMMVVGHLFRNVGRYSNKPSVIVSGINNGLAEGNEQNMFCTLFCGVLDMETGRLDYCNAGHNAPIFINKGRAEYMKPCTNLPTGILADFPYQGESMQIERNNALFLYTDGVTEAENRDNALFGDENTLKIVDILKDSTMEDLSNGVFDAVKAFVDGNEQSDDITMLCLRWK